MRVQRFLKCCLEIALFLLIMVILSTQAQAHKVMIFAY